ncbi:MAG: hypothetical protein IPM53_19950 [Anaerolineaceae bacterium]|nr:hypothetical protein [Anaerolineaceae bacterium]
MNYEPDLDPEAVVLSKVYALLIRAARQKKAKEQQSDGRVQTGRQDPVNYEGLYTPSSSPAE